MRLPERLDSLFLRLLLTQLALVTGLGLVMGGLFCVERTNSIATLYAERWALPLAQASGLASATTPPPATALAHRQAEEPAHTRRLPERTLRFSALPSALGQRRVPINQIRLSTLHSEPMVWVHVVPPQASALSALCVGIPGSMLPLTWPLRVLLALGATAVLLMLASWTFTRRLTRPLEQLRARMQMLASGNRIWPKRCAPW
nr:hypothetical protein [uncultured Albidiferax sp.]